MEPAGTDASIPAPTKGRGTSLQTADGHANGKRPVCPRLPCPPTPPRRSLIFFLLAFTPKFLARILENGFYSFFLGIFAILKDSARRRAFVPLPLLLQLDSVR